MEKSEVFIFMRLFHLTILLNSPKILQQFLWFCCDVLRLFHPARVTFSLRPCVIRTASSVTASRVSPWCRRLRADRISTAACSLMPDRPPHRATFTSTRRRRTGKSATPSATVWKQTSGKSWEQWTERGRPQYQTHRDPTSPATLRRFGVILWPFIASYSLDVGMSHEQFNQRVSFPSQIALF